jgi:hypothetical protein
MRAAQVHLREGDQDGAVLLARGEIDGADQTSDQTRAVETCPLVEQTVKREPR